MPLWVLLVAVQAVDFGFMLLVLGDIESASLDASRAPRLLVTHGIWTHSLAMTAVYAMAIVAVGAAMRRWREAVVIAVAVASHWLADLIVHGPDLPLAFDQGHAFGLGLWHWPVAAWAVECGLLAIAGWIWTAPLVGPKRRRAIGVVVGLCVLQTLSDFVSPLPGNDHALALTALPAFVAVAAVGWWAERASPSE